MSCLLNLVLNLVQYFIEMGVVNLVAEDSVLIVHFHDGFWIDGVESVGVDRDQHFGHEGVYTFGFKSLAKVVKDRGFGVVGEQE